MKKNNLKILLREKGQAVVEFLLVMTFLVIPILVLIFDGANLIVTYHRLQHATREGARIVSEYPFSYEDVNTGGLPSTPCDNIGGSRCESSSVDDACCTAVLRTSVVLSRGGIDDAKVEGWWTSKSNEAAYLFLSVKASVIRPFFFGIMNFNLETTSTGYADEF